MILKWHGLYFIINSLFKYITLISKLLKWATSCLQCMNPHRIANETLVNDRRGKKGLRPWKNGEWSGGNSSFLEPLAYNFFHGGIWWLNKSHMHNQKCWNDEASWKQYQSQVCSQYLPACLVPFAAKKGKKRVVYTKKLSNGSFPTTLASIAFPYLPRCFLHIFFRPLVD